MRFVRLLAVIFLILPVSVLAEGANKVEFITLLQTTESWNGDKLQSYGEGEPEITLLKVVVPPGGVIPTHKHPVINAAIIMTGEITVYADGEQSQVLKAGDAVVELFEKWHSGKNTGSETVELMVFYAGIKGKPLSVKP